MTGHADADHVEATATTGPDLHRGAGANAQSADAYKPANTPRAEGNAGGEQQPARGEQTGTGKSQGDEQPEQIDGPGAAEEADEDRPPPRAKLSKEAAFLKAAEDTQGGQGAMLFSEFVEALTRLCLARYGPRATQGKAAASSAASGTAAAPGRAGGGGRKIGVGGRRTNISLKKKKMSFGVKTATRARSQNVRTRVRTIS